MSATITPTTESHQPSTVTIERSPPKAALRPWPLRLGSGLLTGFALGVGARGFMRLLTDDPEFTWSGTLFIVGLFTVFAFVQGVVDVVRSRTSRHWMTAPVRLIGGFSYLLLGFGAGIVMAPFLWFGALARWRSGWRRWLRLTLGGLAVANVVGLAVLTVIETGFNAKLIPGFAVLLAVYLGCLRTVGPTLRPR